MINGTPNRHRHKLRSQAPRRTTPSVRPSSSLPATSTQNTSQEDPRTRKATLFSRLRERFRRTSSRQTESSFPHPSTVASEHGVNIPTAPYMAGAERMSTTSPTPNVEVGTAPIPISPSVHKTNNTRVFTREPRRSKDNELKMLHYSYIMSESASLREAVGLTHSLTETKQTGPTAQDCVHLAKISSAYIMSVIDYTQSSNTLPLELDSIMSELAGALREIQKEIYELPEVLNAKTANDWKREKVVTDQCKVQLESVISKSEQIYPALVHRDSNEITDASQHSERNSQSVASSVLGTSIVLLTILKEAADIVPVPFLKGSVGTVLIILQTVQITRSNREDIMEVADMAEDFVASIWEACQGSNQALSHKFQNAVDTFTSALLDVLKRIQAFSKRSLLSRVVGQISDKNEIIACKQLLQHAIAEFQIVTQVLQQHTIDTISAVQNEMIETTHNTLLASLPRAPLSFGGDKYVASTRTDVLEAISEWIENSTEGTQVFWLHGAAGMGKTTITRHLQEVLEESRRLSGYFFFQRQSLDQEYPELVIKTLAYQLAILDKGMKSVVINALQHPLINQQFITHFQALVLDPLIKGAFPLPTVILFDALDEYQYASRFLDVLVKLTPRFPPNVKFFVTSRPEFYIRSQMVKLKAQQWELRAANSDAIESIFRERLQAIDGWRDGFPAADKISQLVRLADGLPVWAAIACTFITQYSSGNPDLPLRKILESQSEYRRAAETALDALYHVTLEHIFPMVARGPDLQAEHFRTIFGTTYVVDVPLTVNDVEALLGEDEPVSSVISNLSSLQTRASSNLTPDTLITPASDRFHASFLDFIVDIQRCTDTRFRLDIQANHQNVARACLRLMHKTFDAAGDFSSTYMDLSGVLLYVINNWVTHVIYKETIAASLRTALSDFSQHCFMVWFKLQFESVTGSPMSPEIAKGYSSGLISDTSVDRFAYFSTLVLYAEQMGHPIRMSHLNMAISMQSIALHMVDDDSSKRALHLAISGRLLMSHFIQFDKIEDLRRAIEHYREAVSACPPSSPRRSPLLYYLGSALLAQVDEDTTKDELDEVIGHFLKSFELLPKSATSFVRAVLLNGRATAFTSRFEMFEDIADLTEALSLHREVLDMSQQGGWPQPEFYSDLADTLELQFDELDNVDDLKEVISLRQKALFLSHKGQEDSDRSNLLNDLANTLGAPSVDSGDGDKLHETIPLCRDVLAIRLLFNDSQSSMLRSHASSLEARFQVSLNPDDLDKAISSYRQVLELCPLGDASRADSLENLGNAFFTRFEEFGDVENMDESILLCRQALELCPPGHPDRAEFLHNLGDILIGFGQFSQGGKMDEGISLHQQALELRPPGHLDRADSLNHLGNAFQARAQLFGQVEDLDKAVLQYREVFELWPPDHPDHDIALDNLGNALSDRFQELGQAEDMEEAIVLHRQALELCPSGHRFRANSLDNLGTTLRVRFEQLGAVEDLDGAISLHQEALELRSSNDPCRASSLTHLGDAHHSRFGQCDQIEDLNEAISLYGQALGLRPPPLLDRAESLNDLGVALCNRFDWFGEVQDLEEALSLHRQALEILPPGHPSRTDSLEGLGEALLTQFNKFGQVENTEEGISFYRQALELYPPDHPGRADIFDKLGNAFQTRFEQSEQLEDLNEAILLHHHALKLRPPGHPSRAVSLNDLGTALYTRSKESSQVEDLNEAILLHREALKLHQPNYCDRDELLSKLGDALQLRFEQHDQLEDLEEAISLYRQVLELRPLGHDERVESLLRMGSALQARFERLHQHEDQTEADSLLDQACELCLPSNSESE